jgi:putative nucleotidyltransferase with HDIG domain
MSKTTENSISKKTKKLGHGKRILLVDDEKDIIESIRKFLEEYGFQVATAQNGKTAQQMVALEKFDVVVSDIHMPGSSISGLELLSFTSRVASIPVILISGFAELSDTAKEDRIGAASFLAKPLDRNELLNSLKKCLGIETQETNDPENLDENYSKLNIDDFVSGKEIRYDVFVRLSAAKYVKIAHPGENVPLERIQGYRDKGIKYLYLTKDDFYKYIRLNLSLSQAVRKTNKIHPEKKMYLMKHTGEVILEHLYSDEIDAESFDNAKLMVENTVSFLAEEKDGFDLLSALNSHSDFLYAHSLGVSLYSTLIARELRWTSPANLYKLSMSGLLHDIGKKEIDRALIEKPRADLNSEETKIFETHSTRGMEILARLPTVSSDVIQIVLQHHERDTGFGYPSRLTKNKIHPLAKLLAVADEFCKIVLKGPDSEGMSPSQGVEKLLSIYQTALDPQFVTALARLTQAGVK